LDRKTQDLGRKPKELQRCFTWLAASKDPSAPQ